MYGLHIPLQEIPLFHGSAVTRSRQGMRTYLLIAAALAAVASVPGFVRAQAKGKPADKPAAAAGTDAKKDAKEPAVTRTKTGALQFEALKIETEKEGPGVIFIDNWTPATKRDFGDDAVNELDRIFMDIRGLNRSFDRRIKQAADEKQIQTESATRETERKLLSLDIGRVKTDRATVQR